MPTCVHQLPSNITGRIPESLDRENRQNDIANDIAGHIYTSVGGFYAKFFEVKPLSSAAEGMIRAAKANLGWDFESRDGFAAWLLRFQSDLPRDLVSTRYMWLGKAPGTSTPSPDVLVLSHPNDGGRGLGWADVLVVGEFCSNGSYRTGLLELCGHARAVFSHQPARLFLHGFYLVGGEVELWMFDRSGMYSCEAFDIAQGPHRFLTVLLGYMLMDAAELGLGALIQEDSQGRYILGGDDEDKTGAERIYLGNPPIFERTKKNIVDDGLTSYRARLSASEEWEYVVKLKWSTASGKSEAKMLELIKKRKIWGVIQLLSHQTVCSTHSLHHGLLLGAPRKLRHDATIPGRGKVGTALDHTIEVPEAGNSTHERSLGIKYLNCTVVSPLGESLHRFETVPELLNALRDAIKAHRCLYQDGGILHQDVCPGNIIIPRRGAREEATNARGVMIDLDVAKKVSEPWKQFQATGTRPFQAIGVLQAYLPDNPHTYRHDLESFLYTFLFLATCQRPVPPEVNQLQLPTTSILYQWTQGRPVDQAICKTKDMDAVNFRRILAQVTPEFKRLIGLAEALRGALFPIRDGKLWTGTEMTAEGTNALYDSMIDAFDVAIQDISPSL